MSDHTQTKLCVSSQAPTILKAFDFMGETSVIVGSASGYDNSGFFPSQEQGVANARRLVAAWNACDGVPTDALEQIEGLAKAVLPYHQIKAQRDALLEALKEALPFMENEAVIQGYGFYRPSNPNDFHPDHESCTEQEIANHKAACEAYDAGNYRDDYGDGWVTPTMHVTKAPWGIGSYTDTIPELEARCERARAAIAAAEKDGTP